MSTVVCDVRPGLGRLTAAVLIMLFVGMFVVEIGVNAIDLVLGALDIAGAGWANLRMMLWHAAAHQLHEVPKRLFWLMLFAPVWLPTLVALGRMLTSFRVDESGIHRPIWPAWWARLMQGQTIHWDERTQITTCFPWIACHFRLAPEQARSNRSRWNDKVLLLPALWLLPDKRELFAAIQQFAPPEHPVRLYYGVLDSARSPGIPAASADSRPEEDL